MKKLFLLSLVASFLAGFLPESGAQSNTIVRFRVSYGSTVLGNIDVELFDQEKPVTVSNFLAYVDSGRYKRTLLHQVFPGVLIQGGAGTIVNPYSAALFQIANSIEKSAPVANEFNVGTVHSNLFGTLAMVPSDTNATSVTSSWIFNLGNNSVNRGTNAENLDAKSYPVFGRAINGTNHFKTFNSLVYGDGIMPVSDTLYIFSCGVVPYVYDNGEYSFFVDGLYLPVSPILGNYCVRYMDMLTVDVFRLNGPADTAPPTVVVENPVANTIVESSQVTVSGTATDTVGVDSVDVILNHESLTTAAGGPTWSTVVTNVLPGSNTVVVVALDAYRNQSKPVFRNFFHRVQRAFDLTTVGQGTVTGRTNTELLDLGRNYSLVAKPEAGHLFKKWEGTFETVPFGADPESPNLTFYYRTNTSIRAVFVPDPFAPTKGIYNGLFISTNSVLNDRVGYFTMNLTPRGTYSGKLTIEGKPVPFKGQFSLDGTGGGEIVRKGNTNLYLNLTLLTNGSCQVTGTLSILNGAWGAIVTSDLATFNTKTNPAPRAGLYTMVIPGTVADPALPRGDSYATVKIDGNGKVSIAGAMADNTKVTQQTTISKDGTVPFFASLYTGKGVALGWLDVVTNDSISDIVGDVTWIKTAAAGGKYYPAGFQRTANAVGSTYVKPATATTRVVEIPSGVVSFAGGNLPSDFSNNVTIAPNSSVTTTSPNKLTMSLNKGNGLMTGTAVHPTGAPTVKYSGVVLQNKSVGGYGFFLGTNQSGRVLLEPNN